MGLHLRCTQGREATELRECLYFFPHRCLYRIISLITDIYLQPEPRESQFSGGRDVRDCAGLGVFGESRCEGERAGLAA